MNQILPEDLKKLVSIEGSGCVSLYLSTHRNGANIPEDQLRLRNGLREAEARLAAADWRAPDIAARLEPGLKLLGDSYFWRHLNDGLALFLTPEGALTYCLPLAFTQKLIVSRRPHLTPLWPLFYEDGVFYVLALSQNSVHLFRGTRWELGAVSLEGLPHNLAEALRFDSFEKEVRFRPGVPRGPGRRWSAIFYGSGGGEETYKEELAQYCHQIDHGLREWLKAETAPLVLAGVTYLTALYREQSRYPHLVEASIDGNPERLSPETLHEQAWAIVAPHFRQRLVEALAAYRRLSNTHRVTADLHRALHAAHCGRVQTLFVAADQEAWGTFNMETQAVQTQLLPSPDSDELLNLAALRTYASGGNVYVVPKDEMPATAPLAALLRY
ncbi:MAG: hypothetical protein NZM11_03090 [Anaerolineales bacterium]|nr:hypothetical protein [Anaerolineales bacterium]